MEKSGRRLKFHGSNADKRSMSTTTQNKFEKLATISIHVEQDDTPVRGNAMASGDDAADRILTELSWNVWAWATVEVRADSWGEYSSGPARTLRKRTSERKEGTTRTWSMRPADTWL